MEMAASKLPTVALYAGDGAGVFLEVNAERGTPFETDIFEGETLFLHRPDPEPENWRYAEHFRTASRRWEMRCQGVFKVDPGEVFFGAELEEDLKLANARHAAAKWLAKMVGRMAAWKGVACHYNFDMVRLDDGSEVRPHFVAPILTAQAIVITPKGQIPPPISRSFPETPLAEKLRMSLNTYDTFTFCFWFKQLDFARWELCNFPLGYRSSLDDFIEQRPIHLLAYGCERTERDVDIHADSSKKTMVRVVCSPPQDASAASNRPSVRRWSSNSFLMRSMSDRPAAMPTIRMYLSAQDEGKMIDVNAAEGIRIENDIFVGEILFLQRPSPEPAHDSWPYAAHFRPTQRRWEMRCQGKFKVHVKADDVYFGAELSRDPSLTWLKRKTADWMLKVAKTLAYAKGVWFHHSFNAVRTPDGSVVRPHYVSPAFAAEALHRHPAGVTPPPITESVQQNKLAEKREVVVNLEDSYTIALWNKQLDFGRWQICGMPFGWTSPITPFIGDQPINMVAYVLKNPEVPDEELHADSNKRLLLRLEVSPPPISSGWSCHQGLRAETGVITGIPASRLHSTAEFMGMQPVTSEGPDVPPSRCCNGLRSWLASVSPCFAWCK